jgi:transposase
MSYSLDLRKKVIDYVDNGGSITKAATLFNIGRATIYRWLSREELEATKVKHRSAKARLESPRKGCPRKSRGKIKR